MKRRTEIRKERHGRKGGMERWREGWRHGERSSHGHWRLLEMNERGEVEGWRWWWW